MTTIAPVRKKRAKSTSTVGHYLNNDTILPIVKDAKAKGRVTDELAKIFMVISERLSYKSNFIGYSFREDMVSYALINLVANGLKFNPEKSNNPFTYYTTMCYNSFLQYMADEKKHRNIRDAQMIEVGANPSFSFSSDEISDSDNYHAEQYNSGFDDYGSDLHFGNRAPTEVVIMTPSDLLKMEEETYVDPLKEKEEQ